MKDKDKISDREFITGFSAAARGTQERLYAPLLIKSGFSSVHGGYALTKRRANGNVIFSGDKALSSAAALLLAKKKKKLNVFILTDLMSSFPRLPSLVVDIDGEGEDATHLSAGTPISGYTRLAIQADDGESAERIRESVQSLSQNDLVVKTALRGGTLAVEAYHFNADELESFTMRLAAITANGYTVTVEEAFPPLAQSNAMLSKLFPKIGKTEKQETEFDFKPYHAAANGECVVLRLAGRGEKTVSVLTDIISLLTED